MADDNPLDWPERDEASALRCANCDAESAVADDEMCHHQHPLGPPGRVIQSHPMSEPCLLREAALRADLEAERARRQEAEARIADLTQHGLTVVSEREALRERLAVLDGCWLHWKERAERAEALAKENQDIIDSLHEELTPLPSGGRKGRRSAVADESTIAHRFISEYTYQELLAERARRQEAEARAAEMLDQIISERDVLRERAERAEAALAKAREALRTAHIDLQYHGHNPSSPDCMGTGCYITDALAATDPAGEPCWYPECNEKHTADGACFNHPRFV